MAKKINKDEFLSEAKKRFKLSETATEENFKTMIEDLKFLNGDQWPHDLKAQREADGRPCLKINKLPAFHDRVVGEQRRNRPSIKVKPADDKADVQTAKILQGLIRNIEVQSDADVAYDTGYDGASSCGLGAFRIDTEYASEDSFDQEIVINRIKNQFTVYWDPEAQKADFSDGKYLFLTEKISRDTYEADYPDSSLMTFDAHRDDNHWFGADWVRVAEYFYKKTTTKKLVLIENEHGQPEARWEDELKGEYTILKERMVDKTEVYWCRLNGAEVMEGPQKLAGKYIPIVIVTGKETNIENETSYRGVVRHAKDPMRLYNYNRSQQAEVNALAPRAPWLVTPKQIKDYKNIWDTQHKKSYPYLPYGYDPKAPGPPARSWPQPPNTAIQQEIILSDQELHDTTGMFEASLGERSNETSGRAIEQRRISGEIANIVYPDNLRRALRYAGRVIMDLIPHIYDVPRIVRIINEDESDETVQINQPFEKDGKQQIFDVTVGKYDVIVTAGPSYQTMRDEAVDGMDRLMQSYPQAAPIIADLLVKNMDWPGADEIAIRLKKLVPPEVLAPEPQEGEPPPPPSKEQIEQQMQQKAAVESEIKKKMMEAEEAALDVQIKQEELRKAKAEADEAEAEANMASMI